MKKLKLMMNSLSVYRNLLEDIVIQKYYNLIAYVNEDKIDVDNFLKYYNEFYFNLTSNCTNGLKDYVIEKVLLNENAFSKVAEQVPYNKIDISFIKGVTNDLFCIQNMLNAEPDDIKEHVLEYFKELYNQDTEWYYMVKSIISNLPNWNINAVDVDKIFFEYPIKKILYTSTNWAECIRELAEFHNKYGSGKFAKYRAFVWERNNGACSLIGIENCDPITLSDLVGYEAQKEEVVNNTLQFLDGFNANNVILYGERGTGKSSTVKAILNEYYLRGLRIIEVPKKFLSDFPEIIRKLKTKNQKFIIFVDDLTFEDNESYTDLKSVLEGGLEVRPQNVIIYATTNRRHLVRERFSDRPGSVQDNSDEIHPVDAIQEKLSLADRFGITVTYLSPDKQKYLEIVESIAEKRGLKLDKQYLHREALKWEMWYNGRSPRTARQFVDYIEAESKKNK
jgi:predicted AAA+ superfamily ATPase